MQEKTSQQTEVNEWLNQLKEELKERTGRGDIEVTASPYSNYDALVSCATADKHPIVNFYSAIRGDSSRVTTALDYVVEMLKNWELTQIIHEKAKKDCRPLYERVLREFPHLGLIYSVIDFDSHSIRVEKVGDKIVASFDLWTKMTESDIERLVFYIRDFEATLHRENATWVGATYSWK